MLSRDAAIPAANLSEAAQRIATGDIANAAALLPQVGRGVRVSAYAGACQFLLHILTGITLPAAKIPYDDFFFTQGLIFF
jgi:hypothetical protein